MTDEEIDILLREIYDGDVSIFTLPESVFALNFNSLMNNVEAGFGEFIEDTRKFKRMQEYTNNIFAFSGAKTFHEVKDLSMLVFDDGGKKRAFKQFKEAALKIDQQYNVNWLKAEQDVAFGMAQGADSWFNIEEESETFPLLQYQTVGDDRVRPLHKAWDNIIKPFNDPFWNTRFPPNEYGCRCIVIQLDDGKPTNLKKHLEKFNKEQKKIGEEGLSSLKNDSKMFNVNPGKVDYIFDPKAHPYFNIEHKFKPVLKEFKEKMKESA